MHALSRRFAMCVYTMPIGKKRNKTLPPDHRTEADLPAFMSVREFAQLLRLNEKTVYDAIKRGGIPGARRVGRSIRIERAAALQWLACGRGER